MSQPTTIQHTTKKPPSRTKSAQRDHFLAQIAQKFPSITVNWQDKPRLMAQLVACGATWREIANTLGYSNGNSARGVALAQQNWSELLAQARAERWRGIEGRIGSHMENLALNAQEEREQVKAGAELLKHVSRMDGLHARSGLGADSGVSITIHVDATGGRSGLPVIEVARQDLGGQDAAPGLLVAGQDAPGQDSRGA